MKKRLAVMLALGLGACGGSDEPRTPVGPGPSPSPDGAGSVANARNGLFDVAVLVDSTVVRTPSRAEIDQALAQAETMLLGRTGERLRLTEVVFAAPGVNPSATALAFLSSRSANPPEAVAVLSEDGTASTFGGYSVTVTPPFPFTNEFASPRAGVGSDKVYVAVVRFDHPYARCGYDDAGNRIASVAVGGECRNRPGSACVARGDRYICADAVDDLYSQPGVFQASTFVHEFLHPFGIDPSGNLDHYGTPACIARTGMSARQASDLREAQESAGMCPDVFPRFRRTP